MRRKVWKAGGRYPTEFHWATKQSANRHDKRFLEPSPQLRLQMSRDETRQEELLIQWEKKIKHAYEVVN